MQIDLKQNDYNKLLYILTKETRKTPESVLGIFFERVQVFNYLVEMEKDTYTGDEISDADYNLNLYNKCSFKNGTTYRIHPYITDDYEPRHTEN